MKTILQIVEESILKGVDKCEKNIIYMYIFRFDF